jgi:hypothetical protein
MMKKTLLLLVVFFVASFSGYAQVSEEEARRMYDEAEQQYEAQQFYECYQLCMNLKEKMGKDTPKVLYLMLKAIYNNLESNNEKSQNKINKAYENYSRFFEYSSAFFTLIDKKTYPEQKLSEIEKIHDYFQKGMSAYEHQKGRRPEDAIAFLNECGRKFPLKKPVDRFQQFVSRSVRFTLDSPYLKVVEESAYLSLPELKSTQYTVQVTFLDFRKITGFHYISGNVAFKGPNKMEKTMPRCIDGITSTYRVSWKSKKDEDRHYKYIYSDTAVNARDAFFDWKNITSTEEFRSLGFTQHNGGWNLLILVKPYEYSNGGLFDQTSAEFRDGDYERRITEAFQFLIDYFPKQTVTSKKENKPPLNSKF